VDLAAGHAAFATTRGAAGYSECLPYLSVAERHLRRGSTPFLGWVLIDQAVCAYYEKDHFAVEELLGRVLADMEDRPYPALRARAAWILGLTRAVQARFAEATREIERAMAGFQRIGEEEHSLFLHSTLARNLENVGAVDKAWRFRHVALTQRHRLHDPERIYTIVESTTHSLTRLGHLGAALYFAREQGRAARRARELGGDDDLLAYSELDLASLLSSLDRPDEAAPHLATAEQAWRGLPEHQESRRRLRAELDLTGALLSEGGPDASLPAVDRALEFFRGQGDSPGHRVAVLQLLRKRAGINLFRGADSEAESDLQAGIDETDRQRSDAGTADQRASFMAQARALFDDMIRLQIERRDRPFKALGYLEQATNRLLSDTVVRTPPPDFAQTRTAS